LIELMQGRREGESKKKKKLEKENHHLHHLWIQGFRDGTTTRAQVINELDEGLSLHLLPRQVRKNIIKIKADTALLDLPDKEVTPLGDWDLCISAGRGRERGREKEGEGRRKRRNDQQDGRDPG